MNVELVSRIRPSLKAEGAENLIIEGQRLAAHQRGPFLNFKALHRQDAANLDIFRSSVDDLLDFCMAGFDVAVLVMGESGSGKSYTIAGEGTSKSGFVPMVFDALFTRLSSERYMADSRVKRQSPMISLEMYEVYNELIKDLLQVPSSGNSAFLELGYTAEKGTYVKNGASVSVKNSTDASAHFRQGLQRRTEQTTDYGPAQKNAATILHINLHMKVGENQNPNKSRLTVVELPGLEKLSDDPNQLRHREGPALSKGLIALNQVVTSLSNSPYPDRVINYSGSKITQLLQDEIGGNCKTRAILCLKPNTNSETLTSVLNFSTRLGQIKNFPIVNDSYAQNLLTQYRAKIIDLQEQSGVGPAPTAARMTNAGDPGEAVRNLESENLRLKDEVERLRNRMDSMQQKFGTLANTKRDLSEDILMTEEEKLKLHQSLVDMEINNVKIREECEASKFELTNKLLVLENDLLECQNERDKATRQARSAKERLSEMERDRKDLADEYVVLKTNYLALCNEHQKEVDKNEDLSIELLNLANAKASLMKQVAVLNNGNGYSNGDAEKEVDRVKAMVIDKSSGRVKANEILGTETDRQSVEQTLFANKKKYEGELSRVNKEYGEEAAKKERQMSDIQRELKESRNLARERQHKISEINAGLLLARGEKEALEVQVNRLQHKVKDLGEEYRMRLMKYIDDIKDYMDSGGGVPDAKRDKKMKHYVDNMLKDMLASHREREDQLSKAAQQYREGKKNYMHKYEELLIAYRNLRQQCEQRGMDQTDMGPDEHRLALTDSEISSGHLKEINRLKKQRDELQERLTGVKVKYGLSEDFKELNIKPGERSVETMAALRKQLREFTMNTQQQLEDERTKLLSENNVLKEQLAESQNYIDSHLARYKQEVIMLRRRLGEDAAMMSTDRSIVRSRRH